MNPLDKLKTEVQQYQYLEDDRILDVCLAGMIATRMNLGDPIWLILIGASSGGKSQILRPLALTDRKFIHRIDDLTENTFLSGMKPGKGQADTSLLSRIGPRGILVLSDLTVLFSKNHESRSAILSQFRMIYDGEMVKHSGTSGEPITWKGALGVLAGSTPSIYHHFEEVADMGERFIYWRMKDYSADKAARIAVGRGMFGKELDKKLSELYQDYIKDTIEGHIARYGTAEITLPPAVIDYIIRIAIFAERVRTPVAMDFHRKEITRIPISAMPMRVCLQLITLAKALTVMRGPKGLGEVDLSIINWCGYSLANEEKRACLRVLAGLNEGQVLTTQSIADRIGLSTTVVGTVLQNLGAVGVLERSGGTGGLAWKFKNAVDHALVQEIEGTSLLSGQSEVVDRALAPEEHDVNNEVLNHALNNF
jgi:predicted transcriptional regulator